MVQRIMGVFPRALMRAIVGMAITALSLPPAVNADVYADIDDHIRNNRLSEARALIQTSLDTDDTDSRLYVRLSVLFEYQGDHQRAIDVLQRGARISGDSPELFHYNIGNNYFALREYAEAEQSYSTALEFNVRYEPIYINRANTRVWRENYVGAIEDYTQYLSRAPNGAHRREVQQMIMILRDLLRAEETRERERLTRGKRLLDDALFLLGNSYNDGQNSRARSATIDELEGELDIAE